MENHVLHTRTVGWKQTMLSLTMKSHNNEFASFSCLLNVVAFIEALVNEELNTIIVGGVIEVRLVIKLFFDPYGIQWTHFPFFIILTTAPHPQGFPPLLSS